MLSPYGQRDRTPIPGLRSKGESRLPAFRDALIAAGPCGAMPFVIALQYGVRTEAMAKAILISTFFNLISLAVLTS